jgi:hypothetical protein
MYLFYLGGMLLPITPSAFSLKDKNQNRTMSLADGSEIILPEVSGLCEISFKALLPMVQYPFCIYEGGFKDGLYFARVLRSMKESASPIWFRLLRYGKRSSTDIRCVIEELSFEEDALNGGDITASIMLKQYVDYATRVIDVQGGASVTATSSDRVIPAACVVNNGDTLWTIAKRYYGDGSKYIELYEKNKATIESAAKAKGLACSESGRYIFAGTSLLL